MNHQHKPGALLGTEYKEHEDDDGVIIMITCTEFRKCEHCGDEFAVEFDVRPEDFQYWIEALNDVHWEPR